MAVGARPWPDDDHERTTEAVPEETGDARPCPPEEGRDEKVEAARRLLREAISRPAPVAVSIRTGPEGPDRSG